MDKLYESKFDITTILNKFGNGSVYYGIEIEVEFQSETQRYNFIKLFYQNFDKFILKREPSILCGVEIVSAPMILEILETEIKNIATFCNENHGIVSERTGIHVHTTKTPNEIKIFKFVNNPIHREEIISFAGRLSEYARYTNRAKPVNKGRGYCINIYPKHTTEFRIFKCCLTYEWIIGCVYFCDVIVKNIDKLNHFIDILEICKLSYPSFFIERLINVKKTPLGRKYPLVYPVPETLQYW